MMQEIAERWENLVVISIFLGGTYGIIIQEHLNAWLPIMWELFVFNSLHYVETIHNSLFYYQIVIVL